jgi:flagellar hook-basal body complex protein FliE
MAIPINPITTPGVASVGASVATPAKVPGAGAQFASMLSEAIGKVDQSTKATEGTVDRYLSGENDDIHEMVLATQRNELQFELFLQMRNKVVQAYQEVMRMQM